MVVSSPDSAEVSDLLLIHPVLVYSYRNQRKVKCPLLTLSVQAEAYRKVASAVVQRLQESSG